MVGLKKTKRLIIYDLRICQNLTMVIPFGINLERQVAQRGFWHSDDPLSDYCRAPKTIKTPNSQLGAISRRFTF